MKRNLAILLVLMYSGSVSAEWTIPDAINNNNGFLTQAQLDQQAAMQQAAQANSQQSGMVQGGLSSAFQAQGPQTTLAEDTQTIDRRDNLNQSKDLSNSGAAAAGIAGGILTAIGTPMVMSIDIPTKVAGAMLLADAAAEFAQMAASAGAGSNNGALAGQISLPQGQVNAGLAPSSAGSPKLSPETQQALTQAGIDPNEFLNSLTNGPISPTDILKKYGGDAEITSADLEAGLALKESLTGTIPKNELKMDEGNTFVTDPGPKLAGSSSSASGNNAVPGASGNAAVNQALADALRAAGKKDSLAASLGMSGMSDDMIKNWLAQNGHGVAQEVGQGAALAGALMRTGVLLSRPGINIFQRAHHQYRAFSKWRRGGRIARN